jgi:regulator of sigma E protease
VFKKGASLKAGIQNGDVLLTLNGASINETTLYSQLTAAANQPVEIGLMRAGNLKQVTLSSETQSSEISEIDPEEVMFGLMWRTSLSGMQLASKTAPLPEYNLFTGFGKGVEATWLTFTAVGRTLQQLIGGEVSPKHLAGPIGIASATNSMFSRLGLSSVIFFIGFISINLCIVNLLPIPIADGGQLLFFAVEKIRGKPMPRKAQEIVQQVTIVLLIAFFLYVTWFDGMSLIYDLRN